MLWNAFDAEPANILKESGPRSRPTELLEEAFGWAGVSHRRMKGAVLSIQALSKEV